VKLRHKLHSCDIFGMLETENGKLTRQECKQQYLYIFKMMDKTGSSNNKSSPRKARTQSRHRLIQPNESEVILAR